MLEGLSKKQALVYLVQRIQEREDADCAVYAVANELGLFGSCSSTEDIRRTALRLLGEIVVEEECGNDN